MRESLRFGVKDPEFDGTSQDFSPKGISISSSKALPMNSDITIQFNGNMGNIRVNGKVIWVSSPPGVNSIMGVRFTSAGNEIINLYNKRARYS